LEFSYCLEEGNMRRAFAGMTERNVGMTGNERKGEDHSVEANKMISLRSGSGDTMLCGAFSVPSTHAASHMCSKVAKPIHVVGHMRSMALEPLDWVEFLSHDANGVST
jgi:hypothetical protein